MSRIFLSHSSRDNRQAAALVQWLKDVRPELATEIFIDISAETGLRPGQQWQEALRQASDRCEAVICLLSHDWISSDYCRLEYLLAESLGKQILVARLEDLGDTDITSKWQRCDLFADGAQTQIAVTGGPPARFNTAALDQLKKAIEGTGIGPEHFAWPPSADPQRAPYRGWEPFEDIDAAVFFGRDAAIVRGTDELRAMRIAGLKSLFVVLGPSGSGKSSFLRAGLIPRLQRDDLHFLTLGVMRPERSALSGAQGLAAAIHTARQALHLTGVALGEIKSACLNDSNRVAEMLSEVRAAATARLAAAGHPDVAPALVLPLDQAEELFSADAGPEAEQFLILIADLMRRLAVREVGLIVAATIRTDRYEAMQNHPALDGVGAELFNELKPMPAGHFSQVITGPAARARHGGHHLAIAPGLVSRLLDDAAQGADTLPLLALTLARLYTDYASTGELTLAHYEAIGGIRHVVDHAINEVLAADPDRHTEQLALLRAAFIPWLATINPDNDQPMRRVARYVDLPEDSRPVIDGLVEQRLLVKDERGGEVVVEVALESLLRQWDDLADWLRDERQNLIAADDVERSATAWQAHDRNPAWLLTGTRLADAEDLGNTAGFSDRIAGARGYLTASRQAENQRLESEKRRQEAELQAARKLAAARTRQTRLLGLLLVVTLVIAAVAVYGFVAATRAQHRADASAREATARLLTSEGQAMLAGLQPGGEVRALQEMLAGQVIAATRDVGALFRAVFTQRDLLKIIESSAGFSGVAFGSDGHHVFTVNRDNNLRLWDTDTGQQVHAATFPTSQLTGAAFSSDGHRVLTVSGQRTLQLWDAETGQPIGKPTSDPLEVFAAALSPDGHRIVSGSVAGPLQLWDAYSGQAVGLQMTGHTAQVNSVAFSPDGHRIVSGSGDGTLRLWDADTQTPIGQPMAVPETMVSSVAFSPDGHRIVSGNQDGTVRLWDADTQTPIGQPMIGHAGWVRSVAFSPDGHRIVSGSADKTVRLWNADTGQPIGQALTGHLSAVFSAAFSPDGHRIVSSDGNAVRLWNADPGPTDGAPISAPDLSWVHSVAFSPDGHHIVSGSDDGAVRLWGADAGQLIGQPMIGKPVHCEQCGSDDAVYNVAFSPDGHRIVSGSGDGTVRLWDPATRQPSAQPFTGHTDRVTSVAFSPDGHRIVSGSADKTVRLWNADTGQPIGQPIVGPADVSSVAFSPDGHRVVSGGLDNAVRLWNADTGKPIGQPMTGHTGFVNSVAFSPDGHRIVSGSADDAIRLWDADTGHLVGDPMTEDNGMVWSVAFSPDGKYVVSGNSDDTVRLWDVHTRQPIGEPMTGHTSYVLSTVFSPDGQRIVSGGEDETLRLWPGPAVWADLLCDKLTANMSHKQWHDWISPDIGYITVCPSLPTAPN